MSIKRAFLAGVIGAAIMTIVIQLGRLLGLDANLSLWLGSMVTGELGALSWLLGFAMHLTLGGLFGVAYAIVFESTARVTTGAGATIGLAHAMVSGILLGALPWLHPLMPQVIGAPGMFLAGFGLLGVIVFIALHVMFGGIVGHLYEREPITHTVRSRGYRITEAHYQA
jgi:hypothetical protein